MRTYFTTLSRVFTDLIMPLSALGKRGVPNLPLMKTVLNFMVTEKVPSLFWLGLAVKSSGGATTCKSSLEDRPMLKRRAPLPLFLPKLTCSEQNLPMSCMEVYFTCKEPSPASTIGSFGIERRSSEDTLAVYWGNALIGARNDMHKGARDRRERDAL